MEVVVVGRAIEASCVVAITRKDHGTTNAGHTWQFEVSRAVHNLEHVRPDGVGVEARCVMDLREGTENALAW